MFRRCEIRARSRWCCTGRSSYTFPHFRECAPLEQPVPLHHASSKQLGIRCHSSAVACTCLQSFSMNHPHVDIAPALRDFDQENSCTRITKLEILARHPVAEIHKRSVLKASRRALINVQLKDSRKQWCRWRSGP